MTTRPHFGSPDPLWKTPEGFAATHCTKCEMGWTRSGREGALTVCLLDRQPVLAGMTQCDRFKPSKEEI